MRSAFTDFVPAFVLVAALLYFAFDASLIDSLASAAGVSIAVALVAPMIRRRVGSPTDNDR